MGGHVVHAVPVLPLDGYVDALWLVAGSDGHCEKGLLHLRPLGDTDADPRGIVAAYEYGYGLLALYPETAWPFLRIYHRHDGCGSPIVGLSLCAREVLSADADHFRRLCFGLSSDGHLWARCYLVDGYMVVAALFA